MSDPRDGAGVALGCHRGGTTPSAAALPADGHARAMRVTILTQYYPPEVGAAQGRLLAFAKELRRRGHQVAVVTGMPNYPLGRLYPGYERKWLLRECPDGIPIIRSWVYPATGRRALKRLSSYLSFMLSSLVALAIVPRADVLFVESPPLLLGLSGWLMAAVRRQKLCLNISDLWPDSAVALGMMQEGPWLRLARRLEGWLYHRAWRISGVTDGVVQGILRKGVAPTRVSLLPNGVAVQEFPGTVYRHGEHAPYRFVYAGTHGYAHGADVILRAADLLRYRDDIRFALVGDGADKPRLQALAAGLGLPNLTFRDPVPMSAIPELLNTAYGVLVTVAGGDFFRGTRSAKIFPAMAAARPIVHSGGGEGAEIVQRSGGGMVTPPGDHAALAEAITWLTSHPDDAAAMGRRGRAFVEQEYDWPAIVEAWLSHLGGADGA